MILVDSSVWIDFFNAAPGPAGAELQRLIEEAEPLALTGMIITEILQGLTRDSSVIERSLGMWELLEPHGIATYREAAAILRIARAKGVSLTTIDSLIAAIAVERNATVFTLDKDLNRIARIIPLSLYKPSMAKD